MQTIDVGGALQTARTEDADKRAPHGPLWGVPVAIKANTAVEGLTEHRPLGKLRDTGPRIHRAESRHDCRGKITAFRFSAWPISDRCLGNSKPTGYRMKRWCWRFPRIYRFVEARNVRRHGCDGYLRGCHRRNAAVGGGGGSATGQQRLLCRILPQRKMDLAIIA